MQHQLTKFLERLPEGQSSFSEFFKKFAVECCVPPDRKYESEVERLLISQGLLIDGTVLRTIRGPARRFVERHLGDD